MSNILNSALDEQTISEILSDIEYSIYSEELTQNEWFPYYSDLFVDISILAAELTDKLGDLRHYLPKSFGNDNSAFDTAAMILNYDSIDYLMAADSYMSEEAERYMQNNIDSLASYSKKDQRYLLISVLEFLVEVQSLKETYKVLINLLQEFEHHNSDMEEFFLGGGVE